jgi:hypothetical protein
MPLMAALKEYFYWFIIPTITLSQLETAFKKAVIPTPTTNTTNVFINEIIQEKYRDVNQIKTEWMPLILAIFKKAYNAEQDIKTGAAKLATYEPDNTVDPLMVLIRHFLTSYYRSIDGRITDSKLKFFAEDAFKTGNLSSFKRNVDPKNIEDDTLTFLIELSSDPTVTTSTDPLMAALVKHLNEERKRQNTRLEEDLKKQNKILEEKDKIKLITLPLSQVRRSFDRATYPTMNYSGMKPFIAELGIMEAKDINNDQISFMMREIFKPYKIADDARRAIAEKRPLPQHLLQKKQNYPVKKRPLKILKGN